ncbi:MAG: hypothetical protein ACJ79A_06280 [Gemmatimonadaceae bacterium]
MAASSSSAAPRTTALAGDALLTRRQHFMNVGGLAGTVGAFVWAHQAAKNDGAALALPFMFPFVVLTGQTVGGAIGYGVSFAFYPPRCEKRSMYGPRVLC